MHSLLENFSFIIIYNFKIINPLDAFVQKESISNY